MLTIFCQITATIEYLIVTDMVDFPGYIEAFSVYYFAIVSVVMALLRLFEPIVRSTCKRDMVRCFTCRENFKFGID